MSLIHRPKGTPKTGGRKKGTPNRQTEALQERLERLGVDPFEVLALFAKGDWEKLGYEAKTRTTFTPQGIEVEEEIIKPELRVHAAKEVCQYVLPKRKATELTVTDEARQREIERLEKLSDSDLLSEISKELQSRKLRVVEGGK